MTENETKSLPENASHERKEILESLGVRLILTSRMEGTDGAQQVAKAMAEEAIVAARKRIAIEKRRTDAIAGDDPEAIYPSWLIPTLRAKGVLGENETL